MAVHGGGGTAVIGRRVGVRGCSSHHGGKNCPAGLTIAGSEMVLAEQEDDETLATSPEEEAERRK